MNSRVAHPGRKEEDQRFRDFYGTSDTKGDSILSIAERVIADNDGEATMQQIIDAIRENQTVNNDLLTALRNYCLRKGVTPGDLTDEEVEEVLVKEVRRRCLSHVNQDNTAGRLRKKPVDPTRRVWNGVKENWYGS